MHCRTITARRVPVLGDLRQFATQFSFYPAFVPKTQRLGVIDDAEGRYGRQEKSAAKHQEHA
jgi:hypothetical protein